MSTARRVVRLRGFQSRDGRPSGSSIWASSHAWGGAHPRLAARDLASSQAHALERMPGGLQHLRQARRVIPYLRYRWAIAAMLGVDEIDLWPQPPHPNRAHREAAHTRPGEVALGWRQGILMRLCLRQLQTDAVAHCAGVGGERHHPVPIPVPG